MQRAFQDTYGIPFQQVISNEDLAIGTFQRAISKVLPEMTRVALLARKKEIVADTPNFDAKKFRSYLSRANHQREWGKSYRYPGFGTRALAFFLNFVPKVGPFKALDFKIPTQKTEEPVHRERQSHARQLQDSSGCSEKKSEAHKHRLQTGRITHAGEYELTDKTCGRLPDQLAHDNFQGVSRELRENILTFYSDSEASVSTKRNTIRWARTQDELQRPKNATAEIAPTARTSNLHRSVISPTSLEVFATK